MTNSVLFSGILFGLIILGILYQQGYFKPTPAPPPQPVDCVGTWTDCDVDPTNKNNCMQTYKVTTEAKNDGKSCPQEDKSTRSCDSCHKPVDCVGSWTDCIEDPLKPSHCTQTYNVTTEAKNGAKCPQKDKTSRSCSTCKRVPVTHWVACKIRNIVGHDMYGNTTLYPSDEKGRVLGVADAKKLCEDDANCLAFVRTDNDNKVYFKTRKANIACAGQDVKNHTIYSKLPYKLPYT